MSTISHGNQVVILPSQAAGCVETQKTVATTSVVLVPANPNRKGFIIFNNSSNSCYVKFSATAVASTCTRIIPTFASWEFNPLVCYVGPISCIRNAGTGVVTVFELV